MQRDRHGDVYARLFVGVVPRARASPWIAQAADAVAAANPKEVLAQNFTGTYKFYYLISENGVPYVDVPGHLQLLEADRHDVARA